MFAVKKSAYQMVVVESLSTSNRC